ncbi:MAG TPA: DUF2785 domain-containing protein [Dongiaceae bacterium]|nr:DUF2785 domain-containing protein [Dongiaceae bacterium]
MVTKHLIRSSVLFLLAITPAIAAPPAPRPATAAGATAAAPARDVAFWRDIKAHDFAIPEGEAAGPLLMELCDQLGSPDPEVRDGLGYEIAAAWIYRKRTVSDADLRPAVALLEKHLTAGIGENGTETVLMRSFSALVLSLIAARDNASPFLSADEFDALLSAALDYFAREQDVRGFVPGTGWHHSVAHTADLLKFLGRSRNLAPAGQRRILGAVALKAGGSTTFWSYGEDDRLAAAVLSILKRDDYDAATLDGWLDRFVAVWQTAWQDPLAIDPARYAAAKNGRDLLAALELQIATSAPFAAAEKTRAALLTTLRRM